jgi:hypothetical protein
MADTLNLSCGFIDCTSLSFNYDVMGLVTVSYTVVHNIADFCYSEVIIAGTRIFSGEVIDMSMNQIAGTSGWYETHVTLITTTN